MHLLHRRSTGNASLEQQGKIFGGFHRGVNREFLIGKGTWGKLQRRKSTANGEIVGNFVGERFGTKLGGKTCALRERERETERDHFEIQKNGSGCGGN